MIIYFIIKKMSTSRMNIQSNSNFKVFKTKSYFKSYLDQTLNLAAKSPNYGRCSVASAGVTLSILKDYTNESYKAINSFLRNGNYKIKWPNCLLVNSK